MASSCEARECSLHREGRKDVAGGEGDRRPRAWRACRQGRLPRRFPRRPSPYFRAHRQNSEPTMITRADRVPRKTIRKTGVALVLLAVLAVMPTTLFIRHRGFTL